MSGFVRFLGEHGAHAAVIFGPVAWMAAVIVRARRPPARPSDPVSGAAGRTGTRTGSAWPVLAWAVVVAATAGAALVHASIIGEHFGEGVIYGLFFTGLAAGQLTLAGWIAWKRDLRMVGFLAAGDAATVALWLLTRLVEIPAGPESGRTEPFGALDIFASSLELATVAAAVYLLRRAARPVTVYRLEEGVEARGRVQAAQ